MIPPPLINKVSSSAFFPAFVDFAIEKEGGKANSRLRFSVRPIIITMMSYSRRSRYSRSRSPYQRGGRSVSRSFSMSRSRSRSEDLSDVENPGNNLYVTGLSPRITKKELEKHFSSEGKVVDIHLVVDPWTRESRGFGFVTMSNVDEAERCLKYLDRSVLEGRVITVEKARRRRGRTPTPGRYLGLKTIHVRRRSPSYSPYGRSRSPCYSERDRYRSYSPYYGRRKSARSRSPYSRSPVARRNRSFSRYSDDCSVSPYFGRHDRSVSPYSRRHDRSVSPYYRRRDRSVSPYYRRYDRSVSPYYGRHSRYRSISCSVSPRGRRSLKRSYSRSISRRSLRRSQSRSVSPMARASSRRSYSRSPSPTPSPRIRRSSGRRSRSYSRSVSSHSRSVSRSRSPTPVSASLSPSPSPSR